jgi:hypothetical protein
MEAAVGMPLLPAVGMEVPPHPAAVGMVVVAEAAVDIAVAEAVDIAAAAMAAAGGDRRCQVSAVRVEISDLRFVICD